MTSETVINTLQEAVTSLEAEEATVEQQLSQIKDKHNAIRNVISLFDSPTEGTVKKVFTEPRTPKPGQALRKKASRRTSGKQPGWRRYTVAELKKLPMSEAVKDILASAPDTDFKIAGIMSKIFKDNMPKKHFLQARNRISNILSEGVRNGSWHKGERSTYRHNAS